MAMVPGEYLPYQAKPDDAIPAGTANGTSSCRIKAIPWGSRWVKTTLPSEMDHWRKHFTINRRKSWFTICADNAVSRLDPLAYSRDHSVMAGEHYFCVAQWLVAPSYRAAGGVGVLKNCRAGDAPYWLPPILLITGNVMSQRGVTTGF